VLLSFVAGSREALDQLVTGAPATIEGHAAVSANPRVIAEWLSYLTVTTTPHGRVASERILSNSDTVCDVR
jgi:hypothetical protein